MREDEQVKIVRVRLERAGADLHAADARYHITCFQTFKSKRNIKAATRRSATTNTLASEVAVEAIFSAVRADANRVCSSVDLDILYKEKGGVDCNRSKLVNSLREIMGDEIMMLLLPRVATMPIAKSKAATVLHLGKLDQDDFDLQVKAVGSKITAGTLGGKFLNYSNIDRQNIFAFSEILLDLLSHISPNLKKFLPAAMIGNIIITIVTVKPTMLQVGLYN